MFSSAAAAAAPRRSSIDRATGTDRPLTPAMAGDAHVVTMCTVAQPSPWDVAGTRAASVARGLVSAADFSQSDRASLAPAGVDRAPAHMPSEPVVQRDGKHQHALAQTSGKVRWHGGLPDSPKVRMNPEGFMGLPPQLREIVYHYLPWQEVCNFFSALEEDLAKVHPEVSNWRRYPVGASAVIPEDEREAIKSFLSSVTFAHVARCHSGPGAREQVRTALKQFDCFFGALGCTVSGVSALFQLSVADSYGKEIGSPVLRAAGWVQMAEFGVKLALVPWGERLICVCDEDGRRSPERALPVAMPIGLYSGLLMESTALAMIASQINDGAPAGLAWAALAVVALHAATLARRHAVQRQTPAPLTFPASDYVAARLAGGLDLRLLIERDELILESTVTSTRAREPDVD